MTIKKMWNFRSPGYHRLRHSFPEV